jgi:hypothetical protein
MASVGRSTAKKVCTGLTRWEGWHKAACRDSTTCNPRVDCQLSAAQVSRHTHTWATPHVLMLFRSLPAAHKRCRSCSRTLPKMFGRGSVRTRQRQTSSISHANCMPEGRHALKPGRRCRRPILCNAVSRCPKLRSWPIGLPALAQPNTAAAAPVGRQQPAAAAQGEKAGRGFRCMSSIGGTAGAKCNK